MQCPFVYANGRQCKGAIIRIEAYRCDVAWDAQTGKIEVRRLRSHFHLHCSLKDDHTGVLKPTDDRMKAWPNDLPDEVISRLQGL